MTDSTKTGMPTWLKWGLGIALLPITIIWALYKMWRQGKFNVPVRLVLSAAGIVAALFLGVFGAELLGGSANYDPNTQTVQASETTQAANVAAKVTFDRAEVTEATVKDAVGSSLGSGATLVTVEVKDNLGTDAANDKIVHVSYAPSGGAGLAPRPMLMDLAKTSSSMFKALFANTNVTAVDVTAIVTMVSSGGAESKTAGARIYWDRKKADATDWKAYETNVANGYYWDAFTGAPDFYVHPGVVGGLSTEDQAKLKK
ncbi:MAG: hypothetical protein HGA39_06005 [Coriobacteriia bacterium]|nr:hypothetical protein [Coriobacteriia bacterium]